MSTVDGKRWQEMAGGCHRYDTLYYVHGNASMGARIGELVIYALQLPGAHRRDTRDNRRSFVHDRGVWT